MKFSLIVCTYMRPKAILTLLNSVKEQTLYPDEIIIVDGSTNRNTKDVLEKNKFKNLSYFLVEENQRGLTKQRNFGVSKVANFSDIVCFLDDDTVLKKDYFLEVIKTFRENNKIIGVGGVALNENRWKILNYEKKYNPKKYYQLDGYVIKESLRNIIRNYLGLQAKDLPNIMPKFSNGRTYSYPLNNEIYEVDLLIGMSFSFRKTVFSKINFSTYFEGYGLYEDADFSLRALKYGKNVINTKVNLFHYHADEGRPNKYKYGKMVIRNGWYVWRIKHPKPSFKARFKWNAIAFVLTAIRATNIITTSEKKKAFTETFGRVYGWFSLIFNKPKIT